MSHQLELDVHVILKHVTKVSHFQIFIDSQNPVA